jgi:hypothetical protein
MKPLLYAVTTMTFLVVGHFSPAMALDPKASDANTSAGRSLVSHTTVQTAAAPSPVTRQNPKNRLALYELDPEVRRLYDEIINRAGVPLSVLR